MLFHVIRRWNLEFSCQANAIVRTLALAKSLFYVAHMGA